MIWRYRFEEQDKNIRDYCTTIGVVFLYGFVFWIRQHLIVAKAHQSETRYLIGRHVRNDSGANDPPVLVDDRQPLSLPLDEILDVVPSSMGHRPSVQDPALFLLKSVMKRMIDHDAGVEDGSVSVGNEGMDCAGEPVQDERGDEGDDGVFGKCGEDSQVGSGDEFSLDLVSLVRAICKVEPMTGCQSSKKMVIRRIDGYSLPAPATMPPSMRFSASSALSLVPCASFSRKNEMNIGASDLISMLAGMTTV